MKTIKCTKNLILNVDRELTTCQIKVNNEITARLVQVKSDHVQLQLMNEEYIFLLRKEILKLNSSTLEAILKLHFKGKRTRSKALIEMIKSELASRILLEN